MLLTVTDQKELIKSSFWHFYRVIKRTVTKAFGVDYSATEEYNKGNKTTGADTKATIRRINHEVHFKQPFG